MDVENLIQNAKRALGRLTRGSDSGPAAAEIWQTRSWPPRPTIPAPADVLERADETIVRLDVPGATRRSTDVNVRDGRLEVLARREDAAVADWHRRFVLSDAVDTEGVRADLRAGVLTIHLPKRASARPRRVPIGRTALGF